MKTYRGIAASTGIAIGPAFVYKSEVRSAEHVPQTAQDSATELKRVEQAMQEAKVQLDQVYAQAHDEVGEEAAAIFLAHQEFLSDPALIEDITNRIEEQKLSAELAVEQAFEGYAQQLEALADDYYRERAVDLRDVSRRVQRILSGVQDQPTLNTMTQPAIIVAQELTPSDTAQMNKRMVLGFCTASGGPTSHTAIIARILGIPAVVGAHAEVLDTASGATLIVDGSEGCVLVDPDDTSLQRYTRQRQERAAKLILEKQAARKPAVSSDGHNVEVVANIADATSAQVALDYGAEGVGLYRTEYLFLNRQSVPTEEEQWRDYRAVADVLGDHPLIVRTLDIGGDKQLPYLHFGQEMNPFLGWRAIRMCLDRPDIFDPQLRAILRAGVDRNVKIMFPMVATLEEVRRARQALQRVSEELKKQGVPFNSHAEIGIMIEIPSAAVMADVLASEVDFFSIGTNDLIQYTLACDRVNENVAYLYDPLHPAVLRLIQRVIDAAHHAHKWVGMCGEMAGDLEAIPLLLGMGLDEFSMNAPVIPAAKALIASLSFKQTQEIARNALSKGTASEIRECLRSAGLGRS